MPLDRESLIKLSKRPRQVKLVDVPEMGQGEKAYIRMLNALERDRIEAQSARERQSGDNPVIRARLVQASLCDENGVLLFQESDLPLISELPWVLVERVWDEVNAFNALTHEAVEAAEKKSESPLPFSSSSPSPTASDASSANYLSD